MADRISYDVPKVTRDEATELMIYHLRMAAGLFQATPEDVSLVDKEIMRICEDEVERLPALAFVRTINQIYEAMKEDD